MSFHIGIGLAFEVNPRNVSWVLTGFLAGTLYGYFTVQDDPEENPAIFQVGNKAILGGIFMGMIGDLLYFAQIIKAPELFNKTPKRLISAFT